MKLFSETHPSLANKTVKMITYPQKCVWYSVIQIQENTIDKAVLKEKLNTFFNKLMTIRGKQSPDYSWEPIEDELFKELGLEEK